uniref:Uncharacterized protein n=1 Tax=Timema genevievae TaxID=629358 RepID=A0A7R9PJF7_TIMGE|nr:unnamed protein product [Timema genevievae]
MGSHLTTPLMSGSHLTTPLMSGSHLTTSLMSGSHLTTPLMSGSHHTPLMSGSHFTTSLIPAPFDLVSVILTPSGAGVVPILGYRERTPRAGVEAAVPSSRGDAEQGAGSIRVTHNRDSNPSLVLPGAPAHKPQAHCSPLTSDNVFSPSQTKEKESLGKSRTFIGPPFPTFRDRCSTDRGQDEVPLSLAGNTPHESTLDHATTVPTPHSASFRRLIAADTKLCSKNPEGRVWAQISSLNAPGYSVIFLTTNFVTTHNTLFGARAVQGSRQLEFRRRLNIRETEDVWKDPWDDMNIGFPRQDFRSAPDRDSNLDFPVIGSLVYCESNALDHAATEVGHIFLIVTNALMPQVVEFTLQFNFPLFK